MEAPKDPCASCHFRAGADPRSKNQLSPGLKHISGADLSYSTGAGPNHQLEPSDFPLTRLATPGARGALDPTRNPWRLEHDDPLEESTKSH
jgi:hypothetical protein